MPPSPPRSRDRWLRATALAVVALAAAVAVVLVTRGNNDGTGDASTEREIVITIRGRTASPPTGRVEIARGSTVRITVTSDAPDELHVHGYDRTAPLSPGVPATVQFTADTPGLFEVETHTGGLVLCQLVIR